jgi:hypothetical protein
VRSCPQCGANVPDTDDFCGNCGTYLGWLEPGSEEPRPGQPVEPAVVPVEPEQPRAVQPAKPVARRPQASTPVTEVAQNGPPCQVCGTANPLGRKFCRRCGAALTPVAVAPPVPWWRRLKWPRWRWGSGGGSPWPRRIIVLLVLVVLVVGGFMLFPFAVGLVEGLRDKLSTPAPIGPVRTVANAEVPGHPVTAAVDGATNRYWGAPAVGDWAEFGFAQPFRLLGVVIHAGASTRREDFDQQGRPTAVDLVVTASDGTTTTLPVSLADQPGPQRTDTGISDVVTIRVVIRGAAGLTPGRHIALGEIEFFQRS